MDSELIMTLKTGYDTSGVSTIITTSLSALKFDDSTTIFDTNHLITAKQSNMSLYGGRLGFFDIGDLLRIEDSLRHSPAWGIHDAYLFIIVPGESQTAKDQREDMIRIIINYIDSNPTLSTDGLIIELAPDRPVQRVRVSADNDSVDKLNRQWNLGAMMKFTVKIAKQT